MPVVRPPWQPGECCSSAAWRGVATECMRASPLGVAFGQCVSLCPCSRWWQTAIPAAPFRLREAAPRLYGSRAGPRPERAVGLAMHREARSRGVCMIVLHMWVGPWWLDVAAGIYARRRKQVTGIPPYSMSSAPETLSRTKSLLTSVRASSSQEDAGSFWSRNSRNKIGIGTSARSRRVYRNNSYTSSESCAALVSCRINPMAS